jgi:hypothetical protein
MAVLLAKAGATFSSMCEANEKSARLFRRPVSVVLCARQVLRTLDRTLFGRLKTWNWDLYGSVRIGAQSARVAFGKSEGGL